MTCEYEESWLEDGDLARAQGIKEEGCTSVTAYSSKLRHDHAHDGLHEVRSAVNSMIFQNEQRRYDTLYRQGRECSESVSIGESMLTYSAIRNFSGHASSTTGHCTPSR